MGGIHYAFRDNVSWANPPHLINTITRALRHVEDQIKDQVLKAYNIPKVCVLAETQSQAVGFINSQNIFDERQIKLITQIHQLQGLSRETQIIILRPIQTPTENIDFSHLVTLALSQFYNVMWY